MRIIELTDLYHPVIGGLERFVALLSENLAARGHEVHVVAASLPGAEAREVAGEITIHRLALAYQRAGLGLSIDAARPFHPPAPDPVFRRELARLARRLNADVVHAHSWSTYSALGRALDLPVMVTAHDYGLACPRRSLVDRRGALCAGPSWRRCPGCASEQYGPAKAAAIVPALLAGRRSLRHVDRFTAVSDYVARRLETALTGFVDPPIDTLHTFVPDGLHEAGWARDAPAFLPRDPGYLLYVGQLSDHKGIDVLLAAYARLESPPPLVMLGTQHPTTPDPEALPAGVTMIRDVPHPDVIAAMVRATCVVVPSVWPDPLPMTVSEAQCCGVPLVASAVGGIPEQVVDGETACLVAPGDPEALAGALRALVHDGPRRAAMGAAARRVGQRFTAAHGVASFEAALAGLAESRR